MPLYLRRLSAPHEPIGPLAADELVACALSGEDCVSLDANSPFAPVARELDRDGSLRDALLRELPHRAATRYARWRLALFAGLVPVLTLTAFDWAQLAVSFRTAAASLVIDALFVAACTVDLGRRHPRMPMVTTATFAAAGARILLIVSSRCGQVHPLLLVLAGVAACATVASLVLSPSPRTLADHLRHALALAPPTRLPPPSTRGFYAYAAYAIAAAALLPLLLYLLRSFDAPVPVQLLAFIAFALVVPYVGRVLIGRELPPLRMAVAQAAGVSPEGFRPSFALSWRAAARATSSAVAMLVLSLALVRGAQNLLEASAQAHTCASGDPSFVSPLQRFVEAERSEVGSEQRAPNAESLLLAVVVVPIAEELVYRGLVQHALRKRVRRRLAIGLAAALFGLAHLLVYKTVAWQTVLLGLTFGLAYESAGLLASTLVHMLWNLGLSL